MPGPRRFGRLLAPLAFISLIALASPAGADQPQTIVNVQTGTRLVADCGGGVQLTDTFTQVDTITVFSDAAGNPIRGQDVGHFDGVITNSGSGNTYRDTADALVVFDLVEDTTTVHGKFVAIVAPGVGIVIQDTGTISFDAEGNIIFEAGPHQVLGGTTPDFCSVLV